MPGSRLRNCVLHLRRREGVSSRADVPRNRNWLRRTQALANGARGCLRFLGEVIPPSCPARREGLARSTQHPNSSGSSQQSTCRLRGRQVRAISCESSRQREMGIDRRGDIDAEAFTNLGRCRVGDPIQRPLVGIRFLASSMNRTTVACGGVTIVGSASGFASPFLR